MKEYSYETIDEICRKYLQATSYYHDKLALPERVKETIIAIWTLNLEVSKEDEDLLRKAYMNAYILYGEFKFHE